jgi:pilus assembly protein CpaF
MKLSERLGREGLAAADVGGHSEDQADPLSELKRRAEKALFAAMGAELSGPLDPSSLHEDVVTRLEEIVADEERLLSSDERQEIVRSVTDNLLGLGPIQPLLEDPTVTEIMVNGPDEVYVERRGQIEPAGVSFEDQAHIRMIVERIVAKVGRRIDAAAPMVDARLPDGSRVNAVLPPVTIGSPTLTIRKFSQVDMTMNQLIAHGTLTDEVADFLRACVEAKCNILISGGTGTGKTTLLNALSSFIPSHERIITVEDTAELQLQQRHVVRMEARPANVEGVGKVDIRDMVRNALRMRPDRVVVGECRGPEALDMLQAMNTGHEGSLTTLHANSSRAALSRLETMVLTAGVDLPHRAIRDQVVDAIDLVVQLNRLADGSRRVIEVAEVIGMEDGAIKVRDIFLFDWAAGVDAEGHFTGKLLATGIDPALAPRLHYRGHTLPPSMFDPGPRD